MKKVWLSACVLLISKSMCAITFEFQTSPDLLPACSVETKKQSLEEMDLTKSEFITVKVTTKNKATSWGRIFACSTQPMPIEVRNGDEIAELIIEGKCKGKKVYCTQTDEIYIAYPKPPELPSHPTNPEQKGHIEKMKRYYQPDLAGKRKFIIKSGWGLEGFFEVKALG